MITITNPNMPAEVEEIETLMSELQDCQVRGRWDLASLDKWLTDKPDVIYRALERLRGSLEEMYPPISLNVAQPTEKASEAA